MVISVGLSVRRESGLGSSTRPSECGWTKSINQSVLGSVQIFMKSVPLMVSFYHVT